MPGGYTENSAAAAVRAVYSDADLLSELFARLLLGNISLPVTPDSTSTDVTDRAGRLLGIVSLDQFNIDAFGAGKVRDDYSDAEYLTEQDGAGAVLTFDFTSPVQLVWVTDVSTSTDAISHVDASGGVPTNDTGVPVFNQAPTPIVITTSQVQVFAPVGTRINVYGLRRG